MLSLCLLALLASTAMAGPFDHLWTSVGHADRSAAHPITLFVKEKASFIAACGAMAEDIATPGSANWGKQKSFEEMKEFTDIPSFEAARDFAIKHFGKDRVEISPNLDMVMVPTATVGEVERAFKVKLHTFQHAEDEKLVLRRPHRDLKLPREIREAVHVVRGLSQLPFHRAGKVPFISAHAAPGPDGFVSPQLLWQYYGIANRTVASKKAINGIFAALGQSFSPSDLSDYQTSFMTPQTKISKITGPNMPDSCQFDANSCVEASLDVQQITTIASSGVTTFHSESAEVQDIFLDWMQSVNKEPSPPLVNSISYGSLAPEDPKYDMEHFNIAACKAALRGITVIVASGDDGVANFGARQDPSQCGFTPSYPSSVPFITSVGATQGPEVGKPEVVCSSSTGGLITSGGGFSILYDQPAWQKATVESYLKAQQAAGTLPPVKMFNRFARAYPDVAVAGHNYQVTVGGQLLNGVSGTSASAPVFAGIISLVNGNRMAAGKKPIGFLNPILYQLAASPKASSYFNGIKSGKNNCCAARENPVCCPYGFSADPAGGWSPTTGLGSPRPMLSQYLINLP